jgi:hypothetical protein
MTENFAGNVSSSRWLARNAFLELRFDHDNPDLSRDFHEAVRRFGRPIIT